MPRPLRIDVGGEIYHVINRANARAQIFESEEDYRLFESVLLEAKELTDMRILAYCIMPNHWHLVLSPVGDGDLAVFMKWLTATHVRKRHVARKAIGMGHLYQGRYKSFIVRNDSYLAQVCRYVECNALRARLVKRAEDWQWSSLWRRERGTPEQQKLLSHWPIDTPSQYIEWVNAPDRPEVMEQIRHSVNKGTPFGPLGWMMEKIEYYQLASTMREAGRPKSR